MLINPSLMNVWSGTIRSAKFWFREEFEIISATRQEATKTIPPALSVAKKVRSAFEPRRIIGEGYLMRADVNPREQEVEKNSGPDSNGSRGQNGVKLRDCSLCSTCAK